LPRGIPWSDKMLPKMKVTRSRISLYTFETSINDIS